MSGERFKAIGMDDIGMPGGWSVNDGQTFLYTPAEREIMRQSRAFALMEILPHAAAAHSEVKEIKTRHEGTARLDLLDLAVGAGRAWEDLTLDDGTALLHDLALGGRVQEGLPVADRPAAGHADVVHADRLESLFDHFPMTPSAWSRAMVWLP